MSDTDPARIGDVKAGLAAAKKDTNTRFSEAQRATNTLSEQVAEGQKRSTFGYFEKAAVNWAIANEPNGRPQILGILNDNQLAVYQDRDSAAYYASNFAPPPTQTVAAASFTSTTVTLTAPAVTGVVPGMLIDTNDAVKFSARITAISQDRMTLTVSGWFRMGNTAPGQVPTGTPTLFLNPTTKIWAHNANVFIGPLSHAHRGAGFELGVFNNKGPLTYGSGGSGPDGGVNLLWGYDAVNLGPFQGGVGFISRGDFLRGFVSRGQSQFGFVVEDNAQNPGASFASETLTGKHFSSRSGGVEKMHIRADGALVGNTELRHVSPLVTFYGATEANGIRLSGSATGAETAIFSVGADATVNLSIGGKGAGHVVGIGALTGLGNEALRVVSVANQVNALRVTGAAAGGAILLRPGGADANTALLVHALGNDTVQVGSPTNKLGYFGSGGTLKATVTGSRGGNAALGSLLAALAGYGAITDSTTA